MIGNPMIEFEDVQIFTNNKKEILQKLNLKIKKKSFNLLLGPTGSGKTTLLRLIKGLIPYLLHYDLNGNIFIDGSLKTSENFFRQSIDIGYLFQDFELQFIGSTVEQELIFALENMGQSKEVITERLQWIRSNYSHLVPLMNRNPHTLSGGELAQVVFLSTILSDQELLLLDEPLQNLDSQGANLFLQTIKSFKPSKTIIVSTHQIEPFLNLATDFLVLNQDSNKIDHYYSKKEFLNNVHLYPWVKLTKRAITYYLKEDK